MCTRPASKLCRLVVAGSLITLAFPAGAWAQAYPFAQRAGADLFVVPVKTTPVMRSGKPDPAVAPPRRAALPVSPSPAPAPLESAETRRTWKRIAMPVSPEPAPAPVKLNPIPVSPTPAPAPSPAPAPEPAAAPAVRPAAPVPQGQAEDWCNRKNGASADQQIQGCTALIEANNLAPRQRAVAFRLRGNGYYDKKQYDVALRDYDQSLQLDASAPVAYWNRGNALSMKEQYDRAIREYDQAIKLNPSFAPAFFRRALAYQNKALWDFDAYLNEGRYEALAIRDYSESIRLNPKGSAAYNNRGNIHLAQKDYRKAIADYDEAIRIDPKSALYLRNRANAHRAMEQYDRAIADYRKALTLNASEPLRKAIVQALADLGVKG